jgi:predicted ATPase
VSMPVDTSRFVIITGGPGCGKSTLIEALAAAGHAHMPEAGRSVIIDQLAIGGQALPWGDLALFGELMLQWDLRSHREAAQLSGTVFFDRGLPDMVGFYRLIGRPLPDHVHAAAQRFRYRPTVFIAPYWEQIYRNDDQRKQSPEEAERTYRVMAEVYPRYGYQLRELPKAPVCQRVRFVQDVLAAT